MPIILVTARGDSKHVIAGLEAGADEYLVKPVDHMALLARVKSMVRLKQLYDQVRKEAAELAGWNKTLEQRVSDQVAEIDRISRLKRFLAPSSFPRVTSEC
jgi:DNA-binding response OmpR family regulator